MNVKVFTTPTCGYCRQVKSFLDERGVHYREHDVSRDRAAAQEMVNLTGQMGVPVILIDGEAVIGFDRGRLETLLAREPRRKPPRFGLKITDASRMRKAGAYIGAVAADGLGARIGLATGDIITDINSEPVGSAVDVERALSGLTAGNIVTMKFQRSGETRKSEIII